MDRSHMSVAIRHHLRRAARRRLSFNMIPPQLTQSVEDQDEVLQVDQPLSTTPPFSSSSQLSSNEITLASLSGGAEDEGEMREAHLLFYSLSKVHPLTICWRPCTSFDPENLPLPTEIYLMIFEKLSLDSLVTAAGTCKGWNCISSSSTSVWQMCDLSGFASYRRQRRFLEHASHLSQSTLKIIVMTLLDPSLERDNNNFLSGFSQLLERNKASLKALSLVIDRRKQPLVFKIIMDSHIELSSLFLSDEERTSYIPKGVMRMPPRLTSLSIDSASLESLEGLNHLKTLQVRDELTGQIRLSQLLEENGSSLESLALSNRTLSEFTAGMQRSLILLPRLQQLIFSSCKSSWPQQHEDFRAIGVLIQVLRMPMLFELKCGVEMLADLNEVLGAVTLLDCSVGSPIVNQVADNGNRNDDVNQTTYGELSHVDDSIENDQQFDLQLQAAHEDVGMAAQEVQTELFQNPIIKENDFQTILGDPDHVNAMNVDDDDFLWFIEAASSQAEARAPVTPQAFWEIQGDIQPPAQTPIPQVARAPIKEMNNEDVEAKFDPLPTSPGVTLLNSFLPRFTSLQRLTVTALLPKSEQEDVLDGDELLIGLLARGPRGLPVRNLAVLETKGLDCSGALVRMVMEDREQQSKINKTCSSLRIECKL